MRYLPHRPFLPLCHVGSAPMVMDRGPRCLPPPTPALSFHPRLLTTPCGRQLPFWWTVGRTAFPTLLVGGRGWTDDTPTTRRTLTADDTLHLDYHRFYSTYTLPTRLLGVTSLTALYHILLPHRACSGCASPYGWTAGATIQRATTVAILFVLLATTHFATAYTPPPSRVTLPAPSSGSTFSHASAPTTLSHAFTTPVRLHTYAPSMPGFACGLSRCG